MQHENVVYVSNLGCCCSRVSKLLRCSFLTSLKNACIYLSMTYLNSFALLFPALTIRYVCKEFAHNYDPTIGKWWSIKEVLCQEFPRISKRKVTRSQQLSFTSFRKTHKHLPPLPTQNITASNRNSLHWYTGTVHETIMKPYRLMWEIYGGAANVAALRYSGRFDSLTVCQ